MSRTGFVNGPHSWLSWSRQRALEPAARGVQMPEIELHQLDRPYEHLRIATGSTTRRLLSSLAEDDQQAPVLVIERDEGRYVLIDGYQRVVALEKLGRDTVDAVDSRRGLGADLPASPGTLDSAFGTRGCLAAASADRAARPQSARARAPARAQPELGIRRLGLLTALPRSVQELVRKGRFSPYLAMKYLVPMARAISADCEKMAENLAGHQVRTRQMEKLYVAWRSSDDEDRARLVEEPMLFLKAAQEMERPSHPTLTRPSSRIEVPRRVQPSGRATSVEAGEPRTARRARRHLGRHPPEF